MAAINEEQVRSEILRSAMESAKEVFKACLIINGGAAVALLAVIGHLVSQKHYSPIADFLPSFVCFVVGVFVVPIGHGLAYGSNLYFSLRPGQSGRGFRVSAIALALASALCFLAGSLLACGAFRSLSTYQPKPTTVNQEMK